MMTKECQRCGKVDIDTGADDEFPNCPVCGWDVLYDVAPAAERVLRHQPGEPSCRCANCQNSRFAAQLSRSW